MKNNTLPVFSIILLLLALQGCAAFPSIRIFAYDGTHSGRVVDADTGEPVEGVVVLGVWKSEWATVAGGTSDYHDARETVTDKDGNFSIPGQGVLLFSNVGPMRSNIFKAGYKYLSFYWHTLKKRQGELMKVKWEDNTPIIPLKKLTMEERKRQGVPSPPDEASLKEVVLWLKEIDKDRAERGLKRRGTWRGESYE